MKVSNNGSVARGRRSFSLEVVHEKAKKKKKRNKGEGGSLMTRSTRALINQLDESPQKHAALQMFMVQAGCINPLETIKFLL